MLLRPLYESWLLRSTTAPLAPWQRALLAKALRRDERLRCLAMELAEFSHETQLPAGLNAPDLRARLAAQLDDEAAPALAWRPGWASAAMALAVLALGLAWWSVDPAQQRVELARVEQGEEAELLRLPSSTLTPTPTPTSSSTPVFSPTPSMTRTPTPTPTPTATPTPSPLASPAAPAHPSPLSPTAPTGPEALSTTGSALTGTAAAGLSQAARP